MTVVAESDVRELFLILILQLNLFLRRSHAINSCTFYLQIKNINITYDKFVNNVALLIFFEK